MMPEVAQVDVARYELGEAVGDGDDRLAEVAVGHAGGAPEGARAGHVAAMKWRFWTAARAYFVSLDTFQICGIG